MAAEGRRSASIVHDTQSLRDLPTCQISNGSLKRHPRYSPDKIYNGRTFQARLLHHPKLYRFIHKRHHEWTAPIGIIGLYAHPVEHILSNLMPPFLGPLLMGSHMATIWMWFCMALLSTTVAHCGYHFPLLPSPEAHDFHHLKFNQNYGVLGVLDRLHGTDNQFLASKAYERHILLLGLIPLKQQFPDNPSKKQK